MFHIGQIIVVYRSEIKRTKKEVKEGKPRRKRKTRAAGDEEVDEIAFNACSREEGSIEVGAR